MRGMMIVMLFLIAQIIVGLLFTYPVCYARWAYGEEHEWPLSNQTEEKRMHNRRADMADSFFFAFILPFPINAPMILLMTGFASYGWRWKP